MFSFCLNGLWGEQHDFTEIWGFGDERWYALRTSVDLEGDVYQPRAASRVPSHLQDVFSSGGRGTVN